MERVSHISEARKDWWCTGFSTLFTEYVFDIVIVVVCFGGFIFDLKKETELVGYCGVGVFAVIFVGGCRCIGANFVGPSWSP